MSNKLRSVPIPQTSEQRAFVARMPDELRALASPLVEWIRENLGPCAEIRITYDSAQIWDEGASIPFPYSEK